MINQWQFASINSNKNATKITSVEFDSQYELVWSGTEKGIISSYAHLSMDKYISYKIMEQRKKEEI